MTILVSLLIGFAVACLINYAITFHTGQARSFAVCIGGALLGGAVIPWVLQVPTIWAAIIGSLIGMAVLGWIVATSARKI